METVFDPTPMKWSNSKYGFLPEEDMDAEDETQGRRDRFEALPCRCFGGPGEQGSRRGSLDRRVAADV
jgi:hypothetical protein